jgi:hypothetical protein
MPEQIGSEGMYEFNPKEIEALVKAQDESGSEDITVEVDQISEVDSNILSAQELLSNFIKAKSDFDNTRDMVLGWGDKVPQDDILLESKKKYAEELERQFLTMINKAFASLRDEIKENGVVESETARYEPDDIIRKTQVIENGLKGGLTPEIKYITKSNGYRDKVEKIVNLFLEYKKLNK